jgi:hypothetical protein
MPPVEPRPGNLPVDAARLSGRRLGAVGAEVPAVDLIDPRQLPGRTGRGDQLQPEPAGDQVLGAKPGPVSALVTVPARLGMRKRDLGPQPAGRSALAQHGRSVQLGL